MSKITQIAQGEGNTLVLAPTSKRSRKWCITIFNYNEKMITDCTTQFSKSKYIFGRELCKDGRPHLQGYVSLINGKTFSALKKSLPVGSHIELAKGSDKQNFLYCSKEGDFVTNMSYKPDIDFEKKMKKDVLKMFEEVCWQPWQSKIIDMISNYKPSLFDRTIHWIYDKEGAKGKSLLCKYLVARFDVILCEGKQNDVFNQIKTMVYEKKTIPKIVLIDCPRSSLNFINYGCIEKVKNGCIYSGKYEGGTIVFPNPFVMVFANDMPDLDQMSVDRWVITDLSSSVIGFTPAQPTVVQDA